ncbi:aggregation-promoting factor C-terminal-like domain-containing protein [Fructobacillus pseudoficulneus]|nr:hypothetical protein [Fructobacillus pseudoficulneus]SEH44708.1 hypothetical protein SAMN05660469_1187 [Fructobacillus pseudoficulneus]
MMFNKVLITSMAVAGLALTAANSQFNKGKSTTDQAVKTVGSVNTKTVSTAVDSSVNAIKTAEDTAASQTVASSDDSQSSESDDSNNQSSATVSTLASSSATQTTVTPATTTTTTTSASASGDINWLISRESGGNVNAQNGSFYGIGQLSPSAYATYAAGQNYQGNYAVQLQAMQGYIAARYGSVANAIIHFQNNGWY